MKRYFEFTDEKSAKFWEIDLAGLTLTTGFGKIGTSGRTSEKEYENALLAEKEYDKLISEKTKKGYVEVQDTTGEKLKIELEEYRKWITTQDWSEEDEDDLITRDDFVIIRNAPDQTGIDLLEGKFGKMPKSYLKTLSEFGLSEFTYD